MSEKLTFEVWWSESTAKQGQEMEEERWSSRIFQMTQFNILVENSVILHGDQTKIEGIESFNWTGRSLIRQVINFEESSPYLHSSYVRKGEGL